MLISMDETFFLEKVFQGRERKYMDKHGKVGLFYF